MVKGYKYINIKEELIDRVRNLEENKKEVEEDRFNLAGFVTKVLLGYMDKGTLQKTEAGKVLTTEQIKNVVKEALNERKQGNVTTADTNAGITLADLKRELIAVENEAVGKIKDQINELKGF